MSDNKGHSETEPVVAGPCRESIRRTSVSASARQSLPAHALVGRRLYARAPPRRHSTTTHRCARNMTSLLLFLRVSTLIYISLGIHDIITLFQKILRN